MPQAMTPTRRTHGDVPVFHEESGHAVARGRRFDFGVHGDSLSGLLNFLHNISGPEQVRAGRDDSLPLAQAVENRHLISRQRSGSDLDGLRDSLPVPFFHGVDEVPIRDRIVNQRIDWDSQLTDDLSRCRRLESTQSFPTGASGPGWRLPR